MHAQTKKDFFDMIFDMIFPDMINMIFCFFLEDL
jgi:hypothetical protein